MVKKIAIDAGHGGFGVTPGKRSPSNEYEWDFNNKVAVSTIKHLKAYGFDVLRLDDPTGKTDIPLTTRTNKANSWGADALVSCHHNANTGRWGDWTGTETYTYVGTWKNAEKLAKFVHTEIVKAYGLRDRGLKKANFHMVRESKMPAILLEGGYMDSNIDIKKLRDNKVLEKAGEAVADGIAKYFGVTKKGNVKPSAPANKPTTSKPSTSKPKPAGNLGLVDWMKSKKMDSSYNNRAKLASKHGIKGYKGTASQNNQLLVKLQSGSVPKPSKPASKPVSSSYKGNSLVDYLASIGQPTSFKHRAKLAKQHKIKAYVGTASQNTKLLNKLRGGSVSKPKPSKTVKQMADMIIKSKNVPTGHAARQKWLGIDKATYEKVRKEVNKRM